MESGKNQKSFSRLRAACVQMCSGDNLKANLDKAKGLLDIASRGDADIVLLPENFAFMTSDPEAKLRIAQPETSSEILDFLSQQANTRRIVIFGGSVPLLNPNKSSNKIRNSSPVYSRHGKMIALYDKIHLFDVSLDNESHRESDTVEHGNQPVTVDINSWVIGLTICYDLRFPELYRHYAKTGCRIVTVPAAFTGVTGCAHWEVLLRARAIENQVYVLAAGQWGTHPGGRQTWGHSMIVDPWGKVLALIKTGDGVVFADMEMAFADKIRRSMPVFKDVFRPDFP